MLLVTVNPQFSSILEFQIFAAIVGYKFGVRKKLDSGKKETIRMSTVEKNERCIGLINLMALASNNNKTKILKRENDPERVSIFEE